MTALSFHVAHAVAEAYDFSGLCRVVDVGGGQGSLLEEVLKRNEHLSGTVFDLAHMVTPAHAEAMPAEQHHLIGEGDLAAQHLTLHRTHRGSTMPLLADTTVSGPPAAWTFIHIWRVADGMIVEHWACRDDMGLLGRLRS